VHSVRLEHWGGGLAAYFGEVVVVHWVEVLVAKASTSGSSGVAPRNSVAASRMEDVDPASVGEPYSGLSRKVLAEASEVLCCFLKTDLGTAISACYSYPSP
jgi:hypothetical protein